MHFEMRTG